MTKICLYLTDVKWIDDETVTERKDHMFFFDWPWFDEPDKYVFYPKYF